MKRFEKILSGEANQEEKLSFYKQIENDTALKKEFLEFKNLWHLTRIGQQKATSRKKQKLFEEFWNRSHEVRRTRSIFFRNVLKYAAILILAFIFGVSGYKIMNVVDSKGQSTRYQYKSEFGSVSSIILTDGSKIWLNSDSKLELVEKPNKILAKLSGEAFFEIIHNEKREFVVDLGSIQIKDLGTSFNINSYPEDSYIRTTLVQGSIEVLDQKENYITQIVPGEGFIFHKTTDEYQIENIDPTIESAWKDGKFVFIEKSLQEICLSLEKWYNVRFIINNQVLANTTYSCVMKRATTIEQVLKILKITSGIDYKIEDSKGGVDRIYIRKNK